MKKIILTAIFIFLCISVSITVTKVYSAATVGKHQTAITAASCPALNQNCIPFDGSTDHIYLINGDLTVNGNNTGTNSGVVFVEGNLNFNQNYTYGSALTGTVFVVSGDVNIHIDVTRIDAVIISNGIICTAFDGGICPGSNIVAQPLIINGSLISIKQPNPADINPPPLPIRFRRSLAVNSAAAEIINHQVKYLVILRNLFSDTWQKWSEIP